MRRGSRPSMTCAVSVVNFSISVFHWYLTEAGAITQDPIGIGYKAVEAAVKALKGEKLDKNIDTGFHWFDKTNIDSDEIKPLLYK